MKRFLCLVPLVASAVMLSAPGASYAAATGDLWESTTQMTMEGMPAGMGIPAQTRRVCAAKEWTKPPVQNDQQLRVLGFPDDGNQIDLEDEVRGHVGRGGDHAHESRGLHGMDEDVDASGRDDDESLRATCRRLRRGRSEDAAGRSDGAHGGADGGRSKLRRRTR